MLNDENRQQAAYSFECKLFSANVLGNGINGSTFGIRFHIHQTDIFSWLSFCSSWIPPCPSLLRNSVLLNTGSQWPQHRRHVKPSFVTDDLIFLTRDSKKSTLLMRTRWTTVAAAQNEASMQSDQCVFRFGFHGRHFRLYLFLYEALLWGTTGQQYTEPSSQKLCSLM